MAKKAGASFIKRPLILISIFSVCLAAFSGIVGTMISQSLACNVAVSPIKGELMTSAAFSSGEGAYETYSEGVVNYLKEKEKDTRIKAILLDVDSYGGSPVAGEEIANALIRSSKPSVAVIGSAGASAAYWAASGADTIFASANAEVGGIGVAFKFLDSVERNQKEGLKYNVVASGDYKLLGDPNVPMSDNERTLVERDVNIIHKNFVKAISTNRKLPLATVEKLANGSVMLGEMAKEKGLVDKIGGMYEVEQYLQELIGEPVKFCKI